MTSICSIAELVLRPKSQQYRQSAQLFWNSGPTPGGTFAPINAAHAGEDIFKPIVGRGSAYADIDGDGDQDVLLTQVGGSPPASPQ